MKKLILMLLMAVCCLMTANAQKTVVSQTNQKVFDTVDQMPEYPGGMQAMIEFLQANMKYPEDAAKQKVEGRVMVQFVVETDGSISDVHVAKQVFPCSMPKQSGWCKPCPNGRQARRKARWSE